MIPASHSKFNQKRSRSHGFSLVEVTLALAITVFASASITSLIPLGLNSFRQTKTNTVESEIVQTLTNEISMTSFDNLKNMSSAQNVTYYFGVEGEKLPGAAGKIYSAQIVFTDLSAASSTFNALVPNAGTTALITITKLDQSKDYFSVMVGNNQQVVAN